MSVRIPLFLVVLLLAAAGCQRKAPAPEPVETETAAATALPSPKASSASGAAESRPAAVLDAGALRERRDPDRLLRFYAAALHARDWAAAAKAWGQASGVTATTLKASYNRADAPVLEIDEGDEEGAAGSLYYEAPVTLRFGTGLPERGSLVLRRVNDVDGATAEQLRWHIERSTIGQGQ
jgi:hypothetical protein